MNNYDLRLVLNYNCALSYQSNECTCKSLRISKYQKLHISVNYKEENIVQDSFSLKPPPCSVLGINLTNKCILH